VRHAISFSDCVKETVSFLVAHSAQRALEDTLYDPLTCEITTLQGTSARSTGQQQNETETIENSSKSRAALKGTSNLEFYGQPEEKKEATTNDWATLRTLGHAGLTLFRQIEYKMDLNA
jgi:hypothetical protein